MTDYVEFTSTVWQYYHTHKRPMPWRTSPTPYNVVVSELMLQQTQVSRVLQKFDDFTTLFPDFKTLAAAPQAEVLKAWVGLGYHRRAQFLHGIAKRVVQEQKGILPRTVEELVTYKGIGVNTAGAIIAYVHNIPVTFIETNIRSVFIHHFFKDVELISDSDICPLIAATVDRENPREWYWALMDYGTYLKKTIPNPARKSTHYVKQSQFEGSFRQLRARILRHALNGASYETLRELFKDDTRFHEAYIRLKNEQLISL